MLFAPRGDVIVANAIVDDDRVVHAPTVLCIGTVVIVTAIEGIELALVVGRRNAEEEVGEVGASLRSRELEVAVEAGDGIAVHLIVVETEAGSYDYPGRG
jgi:hypothetical protein